MRALLLVAACAVLVPVEAFAAGLSLASGPVGELAGTVKGLATGFFFASLVLALLIEGLGTAPGQQRDYVGVVWRAVWVMVLLAFYGQIFGSVIRTADGVAATLMPTKGYHEFTMRMTEVLGSAALEAPQGNGGLWETVKGGGEWAAGMVGGALFNGLTSLLMVLALLAHWVLSQLGRILVGVFYIVGPLALVFSIPRGSGTAGKWFGAFVSYAIWPVLSALILRLLIAVSFDAIPQVQSASALAGADLLGALGLALVLAATALTVPSLASSLVAAGAQNFASSGISQAIGHVAAATSAGTSLAVSAVAGAGALKGGAQSVASSASVAMRSGAALAEVGADGLRLGSEVAGGMLREQGRMHGLHFGAAPPTHLGDGPLVQEPVRTTDSPANHVRQGVAMPPDGPAVLRPKTEEGLGEYVAGRKVPAARGSFSLDERRAPAPVAIPKKEA